MSWNARHSWSVGEILTAANHNNNDSDNDYIPHEWDYAQITAGITVAGASEGAATTIVPGNAVTYDGTRLLIQVFAPSCSVNAGSCVGVVTKDGTAIGQVFSVRLVTSVSGYLFDTPSAASHTYTFKAFNASDATGTIVAGAGGAGASAPAYIRVTSAKSNP